MRKIEMARELVRCLYGVCNLPPENAVEVRGYMRLTYAELQLKYDNRNHLATLTRTIPTALEENK